MVYLRWCQSRTQFAKTTTTTDARITQKEAPKLKSSNILNLAVCKYQNCGMSQMCQPINKNDLQAQPLYFKSKGAI